MKVIIEDHGLSKGQFQDYITVLYYGKTKLIQRLDCALVHLYGPELREKEMMKLINPLGLPLKIEFQYRKPKRRIRQ